MARRPAKGRRVNLALQGGGSHGAYAWGVLDSFLEDGGLDIEGVSGTSAGSVNAAVYAYGNMIGGVDGARELLAGFWKRRDALVQTVDFERLRRCKSTKPFLAATNVETGKARIFTTPRRARTW
jgi:NTE family protein